MQSFGYEILITILLPGAMMMLALWLLLADLIARTLRLPVAITQGDGLQWLIGLALVLGSGLLGTVIASLCDKIELYVFDRLCARELGISEQVFECQWLRYVDSLEDHENPKNDLRVNWMFFEMRCGLAGVLLSIAYLLSVYIRMGSVSRETFYISAFGIVLFAILFQFSRAHHWVLAEYRLRRFGGLD